VVYTLFPGDSFSVKSGYRFFQQSLDEVNKVKAAIKREQSQTCLNYAEREQSRQSQQKQQKQQAKTKHTFFLHKLVFRSLICTLTGVELTFARQ